MVNILGNINAALSKVKLAPTPAKVAPRPLTLRTSAATPAKVAPKALTLRGTAPSAAAGPVRLKIQPLGFHGVTQAQLTPTSSPVDNTPVAPAFTLGGATPDASGAVTDSGTAGGADAAAAPQTPTDNTPTSTGFQMTPAMWAIGGLAALALVALAAAGHHGYDVSDAG